MSNKLRIVIIWGRSCTENTTKVITEIITQLHNGIKKSLSGITTGTEIVAKSGFKGLVIAIPSGKEIKSLIAKGATTDLIPAATTITVDIEGENGYAATPYNVYYCAWAEGGDDSTYVVTLK